MQAGVAWLSPERQPFLCRPACQNTATCVCRCSGPSPAGSQTKQPAPETWLMPCLFHFSRQGSWSWWEMHWQAVTRGGHLVLPFLPKGMPMCGGYSGLWSHILFFFFITIYLFLPVLCLRAARAFLVAQLVKNPPAMQETCVRFLGQEDPLEKEMATHSRILAWRIPWAEGPGGLHCMGSQESDTT